MKIVSGNRFSGKTYFYTIASSPLRRGGHRRRVLPQRRLRLVGGGGGGRGRGERQEEDVVRAHDAGKDVPQRQEEPAEHLQVQGHGDRQKCPTDKISY